jgi:predicted O-methyltransferase YrrM
MSDTNDAKIKLISHYLSLNSILTYLILQTMLWRVLMYVRFYFTSKTYYRVHSPAIFGMLRAIFDNGKASPAFDTIATLRQNLLRNPDLINYQDHGAGSGGQKRQFERQVSISELARRSASSRAQGQIMYRLVQHHAPQTILELGTSFGIGSMYLITPKLDVNYIGIEGNPDSAMVALWHLQEIGATHAIVVSGTFEAQLPSALKALRKLDFVYIDGDHREEATMAYFEQILPYTHAGTMLVFDDIYWSQGMLRAFERICARPEVTASIDLWDIGIVLFDPAFQEKIHTKAIWQGWKFWEKYL